MNKLLQAKTTENPSAGIEKRGFIENIMESMMNFENVGHVLGQTFNYATGIIRVLFGIIFVIGFLGSAVAWIYSIVDLIRREQTKNNKILWVILIIFVAPIGHITYYFLEDRKKWGIWSIVFVLIPVVFLILWFITQLILF